MFYTFSMMILKYQITSKNKNIQFFLIWFYFIESEQLSYFIVIYNILLIEIKYMIQWKIENIIYTFLKLNTSNIFVDLKIHLKFFMLKNKLFVLISYAQIFLEKKKELTKMYPKDGFIKYINNQWRVS